MISVYVIKNWDDLNFLRQTPHSKGVWDTIFFHEDPLKPYDYVIVYNTVIKPEVIRCAYDNIWCVIGEPPNEYFNYLYKDAKKKYSRVFAPPDFQPALPWHITKNYNQLRIAKPVKKSRNLSFITSSKKIFKGHKKRMNFLKKMNGSGIPYDLYGRGFKEIKNKEDGLFPYKYSLAVESYQYPHYWTEKISDCFLSFTMPLYCGCPNITDYFPKESLVEIDMNDPDVLLKIREVSNSNLWQKNKEAVAYARSLILNKYQFFPYFSDFIKKQKPPGKESKDIRLVPASFSFSDKAKLLLNKIAL